MNEWLKAKDVKPLTEHGFCLGDATTWLAMKVLGSADYFESYI